MVFIISLSLIIVNTLICSKSRVFVRAATAAGTETLIGIRGNGFVLLAADMGISSNGVAFTSTHADKIHQLPPNTLIAAVGDAADTDRLISLLQAECHIYNYESFGSWNDDVDWINCSTADDEDAGSTDTSSPILPKISATSSSLLSVDCIAQMARHKVAERLHTSTPLHVCGLIAGMNHKHSDGSEQDNSAVAQHIQQQLFTVISSLRTSENAQEFEVPPDSESEVSMSQPLLYWLDEYGSLVENVPYGVHGYASDMLWAILDKGYQPNMSLSEALGLLKKCIYQLKMRYVINSQSQKFCIKYLDDHGCHNVDIWNGE
jgi:20S proteasome alpha/beta subunit